MNIFELFLIAILVFLAGIYIFFYIKKMTKAEDDVCSGCSSVDVCKKPNNGKKKCVKI